MAGFFSWLFRKSDAGSKKKLEQLPPRLVQGGFFDVVGEASYQKALESICGGKGIYSADRQCMATLLPEPDNPHDPNAVRVIIERRLVGYLAREHAVEYHQHLGAHPSSCGAKIVGGWKDDRGSGHFGVKLKIKWPPRLAPK